MLLEMMKLKGIYKIWDEGTPICPYLGSAQTADIQFSCANCPTNYNVVSGVCRLNIIYKHAGLSSSSQ
jgi:hypothetical protein